MVTSSDNIYILIAIVVVGPVAVSWFNNRLARQAEQRSIDRQQVVADEARRQQDEVSAQAATAASLLLDAQAETIRKTDEVAAAHKEDNLRISDKLEVIRVDVNSNMTAAMQAELDATEGQLMLMREVVDLKQTSGEKPSPESLTLIVEKQKRINELKAKLKDRLTHSEAQVGGE